MSDTGSPEPLVLYWSYLPFLILELSPFFILELSPFFLYWSYLPIFILELSPFFILCDKICQWLATGVWFSPGIPVFSTNKTDRHNIAEILLKVALNTIKQTNIFTTCALMVELGIHIHSNLSIKDTQGNLNMWSLWAVNMLKFYALFINGKMRLPFIDTGLLYRGAL